MGYYTDSVDAGVAAAQNAAKAAAAQGASAAAVQNRRVDTGAGLSGGGNLTVDRTLSVDFAPDGAGTSTQAVRGTDARLARKAVNTGTGLLGGGLLDVDRTLAVDFAASGTSSATQAVRADDSRLLNKVTNTRLVSTGLGLLGGGDLSADRTLSVDFAASGTSSATKAVRADDSRLSDSRTEKAWPQPANGTDLNALTTVGLYPIAGSTSVASMTPALPAVASGMLEVLALGLARVQRWTTSAVPRQVWLRTFDAGAWTTWRRLDRDTQPAIASISRSQGTTYTAGTQTAYTFRQPIRVAATPERFRLHFRNYEERTDTAYAATMNMTGVWIGEAALDANFEMTGQFKAAPTQIANAFTMPIDGSIYFTPWVDWQTFQLKPGVDYIVSFSYTGPGAENHVRCRGFGWGNGNSSDGGAFPTFNSLSSTTIVPLSTRYELDTPAPRVAMVGDSHTAANNARYPVFESPLHLWAQANGAVPINMGHGGSNLVEWRSANAQRWITYLGTKAEATVLWLGQNDVFNNARTLAQMQGDFITVANAARVTLGPNLYAMTLLPRNGTVDPVQEQVRKDFNAWLWTLPGRIAGVIDAAAAVTDPATGVVRAELIDPDLTHLNTAGCARVAAAIPHLLGRK